MVDQPEASYRLDKPIHAQADAPEGAPDHAPQERAPEADSAPPPGWISLPDCTLSGPPGQTVSVPLVLLHPEVGVALLGVPPAAAEVVEAAFRERLEAARFSVIFSGHLPVVTLAMLPGEPLNLLRRLAAAFATVPPLELGGGDGWVNVVRRALLVRQPIRLVSPVVRLPQGEAPAEPAPARPMRAAPYHRRHRQRNWVWPLAGLTGAGVLVGLALGLHDTPPNPGTGAEVASQPTTGASPAAPPPPTPEVAPRVRPEKQPEATAPPPAPRQQATAPAQPPMAPVPPAAPVLAAPAQTTPPQTAPTQMAPALPRVLVRSAASLRSGPDNRATVLRTAPRGEAFRVHGKARGGWVQVGDATPEGWIHSSLLSDLP